MVKVLPEHRMHEVLKDVGGANKAIRHHLVLIVASRGHLCSLPFISLADSDEVICTMKVQFG